MDPGDPPPAIGMALVDVLAVFGAIAILMDLLS